MITYANDRPITATQFSAVLEVSGIHRPVADLPRLAGHARSRRYSLDRLGRRNVSGGGSGLDGFQLCLLFIGLGRG
jgi:hypothetical protein